MILQKLVNNITVNYTDDYNGDSLQEYYNFVVATFEKVLKQYTSKFTISIGTPDAPGDINVDLQYEHTLQYWPSTTDLRKPKIYRYDYLVTLDLIVDYTITNLENIKNYPEYGEYLSKCIYIPPLLFTDPSTCNQIIPNGDVVTIQNFSERRSRLYEAYPTSIGSGFTKAELLDLYKHYKILLNVHQIDEHVSLEELRLLPALGAGMLIVSEKSPYYLKVPYSKHIIWAEYDNLIKTVQDTLKNYEEVRKQYTIGVSETLLHMQNTLEATLISKLTYVINKKLI